MPFFTFGLALVLWTADSGLLYSIKVDKSLEYPQEQQEKMTDQQKSELAAEEAQSIYDNNYIVE